MERLRFLNKATVARMGTAGVLTFTAFVSHANRPPQRDTDSALASNENVFQLGESLIKTDEFFKLQSKKQIQGPNPPTYAQKIEAEVRVIQKKINEEMQKQEELEGHELEVNHEVQIASPTTTENVGSTGGNIEAVPSTPTTSTSGSTMQMHISGYYCQYDGGYYGDGGGFCGVMADGEVAHLGAAACGPSYPLGTEFEIDGYGTVVCEDRGGGITDTDIDVFVPFSSQLASVPQGYTTVTRIK